MKNLSISILKKKMFMKDLVEAIEYLPDDGSEGNLIDEILLNSKFIEYDANDITEDGFKANIVGVVIRGMVDLR